MMRFFWIATALLCLDQAVGESYEIRAFVVVDSSVYDSYWRGGSDDDMKCYYEKVLNGTSKRFKSIPQVDISVTLVDLFAIKNVSEAPFVQYFEPLSDNFDLAINARRTRKEFYKWLNGTGRKYSREGANVALIFTKYPVSQVKVSAPFANFCEVPSIPVVIVTDEGLFGSADATAHGLGFSLGARRDGDQNTCREQDQYVMSPKRFQMTGKVYDNHLKFSDCSVKYILDFLGSLEKGKNCFNKSKEGSEEVCLTVEAGQRFPIEKQCVFAQGRYSELCLGNYVIEEEMCKEVYCSSRATGSCERVTPVDGTTCGDGKWCKDGTCVFDPKAPKYNETCEDRYEKGRSKVRTVYGNLRCEEVKTGYPYLCRHEYYSRWCCKTCRSSE